MTLDQMERIAGSEVVFAILFILFFVWFLKRYNHENKLQREEAREQRALDIARDRESVRIHKEREDALTSMLEKQRIDGLAREAELVKHLSKTVEQQENISITLQEVSTGLSELEKKVDTNILEIWRAMATQSPTSPNP